MIRKIVSKDKYVKFNQGDIVFPGDTKKKEERRRKAFEVMSITSQLLGFGMLYSQKHHDELLRNNFRFLRHSWNELEEKDQKLIETNLGMIGIELKDYSRECSSDLNRLKRCSKLFLEGSLETKMELIRNMLSTNEISADHRRNISSD